MENKFTPFIGIEYIKFGSDRSDVNISINSDSEVFTRNEIAENSTDYYKDLGFFVEYDSNNKCEAIEFTKDSGLLYEGRNLFDLSYSKLRTIYDSISNEMEEEDKLGCTYHDLGFAVSKSTEDDNIESVLIFSKNYWR